jgi:hypothetical protein
MTVDLRSDTVPMVALACGSLDCRLVAGAPDGGLA